MYIFAKEVTKTGGTKACCRGRNYGDDKNTGSAFLLCVSKKYMPENQNKILLAEKFERFLESKGCRRTPERFAILNEILTIDRHFDVEMLRDKMSESHYKVSKTTIYSNLELLVECGIVQRHLFTYHAVFELVDGKMQHIHLICNECGRIKDVKDVELIRYLNTKKFSAFNTELFSLNVYGTCNNCARKSKKRRSATSTTSAADKPSAKAGATTAVKQTKKKK